MRLWGYGGLWGLWGLWGPGSLRFQPGAEVGWASRVQEPFIQPTNLDPQSPGAIVRISWGVSWVYSGVPGIILVGWVDCDFANLQDIQGPGWLGGWVTGNLATKGPWLGRSEGPQAAHNQGLERTPPRTYQRQGFDKVLKDSKSKDFNPP